MTTQDQARQTIRAAREYRDSGEMRSSARLALSDAIACYDAADFGAAQKRALDSLAYSVGIFHAAHAPAAALLREGTVS